MTISEQKIPENEYIWPYLGSKLIPKEELKPFLKRNNINGVVHLGLHLFLIFLSGLLIFNLQNSYLVIIPMVIHGIFIDFCMKDFMNPFTKLLLKIKRLMKS